MRLEDFNEFSPLKEVIKQEDIGTTKLKRITIYKPNQGKRKQSKN